MSKSSIGLLRAIAILGTIALASCGGYGGGGGAAATLNITINPMTINVGQSATITWTSNGSQCTASGDWTGIKAGSGSEQVSPAAPGTYTYTLRCRGGGYGESDQGSVTLTVNTARAAGLWSGEACCIDAASFRVTGVTNDAGDYRFTVLDTHYVGKLGGPRAAYSLSEDSLAGVRTNAARGFNPLSIVPRESIRQLLETNGLHGGRNAVLASIPYDAAIENTSGASDLQGSFMRQLDNGYALTVTFDADGRLIGADTNGCRLDGRAARGDEALNAFTVVLDVSGCGRSDGRYEGEAALAASGRGQPIQLFLSTSNADSAIAWRLSR